MYTEKYAATAPPTAAGGASLGVVGGRIDFWDNGYQQAISQPYTVAPGETLQTHCWFSTTPMASQIEFGTPTSSEMCQDFIFYYPAQYRGVDSGGSPERFAMCGISGPIAGAAITLCGSLAQSGGTTPYISGDQVDKGDGAKADGDGDEASPAALSSSARSCIASWRSVDDGNDGSAGDTDAVGPRAGPGAGE